MSQGQWRLMGAIVLLAASSMAVYAIVSKILRNTVLVAVDMMTEKSIEGADAVARMPLFLYWLIFALFITMALYLALKDMRHIREQYRVERRDIIRRALQDDAIRKTLAAAQAELNEK